MFSTVKNAIIKILDFSSVAWGVTVPTLDMGVFTQTLESSLTPVFYVVSWLIAAAFSVVRVMIKIQEWKAKKIANEAAEIANEASEIDKRELPDIVREIRDRTMTDVDLTMKEKAIIDRISKELKEELGNS